MSEQTGPLSPEFRANAQTLLTVRSAIAQSMGMSFDGKRDLYKACGYPQDIEHTTYYNRYLRGDIAKAVVEAFPDACWQVDPIVWDTDKATQESPFEEAWKEMTLKTSLLSELKQADILAGIGQYSVLYLGFDDSSDVTKEPKKGSKLLYVTAFREGNAAISTTVSDPSNERYGLPESYTLTVDTATAVKATVSKSLMNVHWSRCIHFADNRVDSKVLGHSRLEAVWNRLQDIDTIMGGGAEGYWRAGFPGIFFGLDKDARTTPASTAAFNEQIENYIHSFSRVIKGQGITPHQMSATLQSPLGQLQCELWLVAATTRIPYRILTGAEQGEMASTKDQDNWNTRVGARRLRFCDPYMLRAVINRLIQYGALPPPQEDKYDTEWPSGREEKESEQLANKKVKLELISAYLSGGVEQMIPREKFMLEFLGMDEDEIQEALDAADAAAEEEMLQAEKDQAAIEAQTPPPPETPANTPPQPPKPAQPKALPVQQPAKGFRALWDKAREVLGMKEEPVGIKINDQVEVEMPGGEKVEGTIVGKDLKGNALMLTKEGVVVAIPETVEE